MPSALNPAAPHHLPSFITPPGATDVLMIVVTIVFIAMVLMIGVIFLRIHTLPERMAHKTQKLQFEIVAILGLLALFTHIHLFWVAGLLLAVVDLPDFGGPLRRMAGSLEKMAGIQPEAVAATPQGAAHGPPMPASPRALDDTAIPPDHAGSGGASLTQPGGPKDVAHA